MGIGARMAGRMTWWRKLGGLLAALVVAVFTMGPGLDTLICGGDGGINAVAAVQTASADHTASVEDGHGQPSQDQSLGVCMHGHCHHGALYVPDTLPTAEAPLAVPNGHDLVRATGTTSDRHFQLKRPPRS